MISSPSLTLQAAVSEIKNFSPDISCAFIFRKGGEIIAQDDTTRQETIMSAIKVFNKMIKHMDAVGGLESLTVTGEKSQICFTACMADYYLVTVSSKSADEKVVYALNRVLIPTIIKLLSQQRENRETQPAEKPQPEKPKTGKKAAKAEQAKPKAEPETVKQTIQAPKEEVPAAIIDSEPLLPKPPVHQLMVEKLSGLFVTPDTVRIDSEVLASWSDLYEGKIIERVSIENLKLKTVKCRFKPIKEENHTKGIIQVPERIMSILEVSKGELVMVKPVIN